MFNFVYKNLHQNVFKFFFRQSSSTIFALASGLNQKCGVAVVRVSGKSTHEVLLRLTKHSKNLYEPRKMYFRDIWHPITNEKIDKSLIVWFKEPKSFTGEDVCEFHVHGGPAIISSLLNALSTFDDLRYAEPGEFARRAFLNGQMDLVEIEGLADLVNAETEMQRKQALSQMEGNLSKIYKDWREKIIKSLANVEAYIDFNEEENVEDNVLDEGEQIVRGLIESIRSHLNDNRRGERLRSGVRVAIVGQPNAGKSSLLNAICRRRAAIVSPIPGTTRDVIESAINIAGYPIILVDTAGLRETSDLVEIEGVMRACSNIESSDVIIVVIDLNKFYNDILNKGFSNFLNEHLNEKFSVFLKYFEKKESDIEKWLSGKEIVVSLNKKDLIKQSQIDDLENRINSEKCEFKVSLNKISCLDEQENDISELLDQLKDKLSLLCTNDVSEQPSLTQQRHRDMLTKCIVSLENYLEKRHNEDDLALAAEELRLAVRWLGTITGHVSTEQILDVIFKDFCIGK
ncbi:tRNA modification GTPase mitochondrial [Brachionus plicatilis]|uniref:tRNA modification GTPase mitochondrial n=1 Tax=Brachionus plicatilis TaxID=10195 RepID=A0A3M7QSM4_BRAPC|nr:tRNA modification GTPase mitochondrial [Brachionus plicatilis]